MNYRGGDFDKDISGRTDVGTGGVGEMERARREGVKVYVFEKTGVKYVCVLGLETDGGGVGLNGQ